MVADDGAVGAVARGDVRQHPIIVAVAGHVLHVAEEFASRVRALLKYEELYNGSRVEIAEMVRSPWFFCRVC